MATVIVSKSGISFAHRDDPKSSPRGEIGGTIDLIHHLLKRGHDVTFFGAVQSPMPCRVVKPTVVKPHKMWTWREQQEGFEADTANLGCPENPIWIESCGQPSSMSFVGNPRATQVMSYSMRHSAPALWQIHRLKAPRCCWVADVRSYPRDGEMSLGWPDVKPAALLDGKPDGWSQVIHGIEYEVRTVPSRSWTWTRWPQQASTCERSCAVVSHAHVETGFRKRGRDTAWTVLLSDALEELPDLRVYGEGFEHTTVYQAHPDQRHKFFGSAPYVQVLEALKTARTSPVVSPTANGFITNKPYLIAHNGALPLIYGGMENQFSWDRFGTIIPENDPIRVHSPADVTRISSASNAWILENVSRVVEMLGPPDFSVVDEMIQDHVEGLRLSDPDAWYHKYGGFR